MPRIFLLAALRNLLRHKLQSLINITSLAIGLTVFGFAFLYVKQELSYDRGWPDGERVHRLLLEQRGLPGATDGVFASVSARAWPLITEYFAADIEFASRVVVSAVRMVDVEPANATNIRFVDPQFIDLFRLEVVEGDLGRAVSGPGFIAVDETTAERLGLTGRVGERFVFKSSSSFHEEKVEYELAAIYRLPQPISPVTSVPQRPFVLPLATAAGDSFQPDCN